MPLDLAELLSPTSCAVLTHELQESIVGKKAPLVDLVAATQPVLGSVQRLLTGARSVGAPVVHNTMGTPAVPAARPNSPLASALARMATQGSPRPSDTSIVGEIGPEPSDIILERHHGMSAFPGTELDAVLRLLGVDTIIATGVSLNVGIFALSIDAVSRGYRVVVATDAVAGTPADYAQSVLDNSLSVLATRLTTDQILEVWAGLAPS